MSSVINKICLKLQFHDIYKILFWGPKTQNIIPPLLTHNILVSKHKILLLQEDLPPITGDPGSCNRMTILPRGRNSVFSQEDFFRRNFIVFLSAYSERLRTFPAAVTGVYTVRKVRFSINFAHIMNLLFIFNLSSLPIVK